MTPWADVMISQPLFQNTFILRWAGVATFFDIIKIVTIFIKTIFKYSSKVKIIENYTPNAIYIYIS